MSGWRIVMIVLSMLLLQPLQGYAAQMEIVKEYLTQIDFRGGIERDTKRFIPKNVSSEKKEQFISLVNFRSIEETYANEIAKRMTDQEVRALIQANSIPDFQSAVKKQAAAVGVAMNSVFREIEGAAKKIGAASLQGR